MRPLLSVCRYWRGLACPLYYQYAAGCYGNKGYRSVRRARLKPRIDEVVAPHLRAMVRHVYLNFSIDSLLGEGSQRTLDRALGDAVFPGAQQLVIEVDEEMGAVDQELIAAAEAATADGVPRQAAEAIIPEGIESRIIGACARLRAAFPGVVAAHVKETRWLSRRGAMSNFTHRMLQGRTVLMYHPERLVDIAVPQCVEGGLTWISVFRFHLMPSGAALIRRCAATLQTIILSRVTSDAVLEILRDNAGALLVYPRLRELRLALWDPATAVELPGADQPDHVSFPALERLEAMPRDPHFGELMFRGNRESLVQIRLYLTGRAVTRLHEAGVLDSVNARPALRQIDLYRPALDPGGTKGGDLSSDLSRAVFEQLVWWALTTAPNCSRIELRGWRRLLRPGIGGLELLVARLRGGVRHLDLPVVCTVADVLGLVRRFPHLNYLGVALDGCAVAGDSGPTAEYVGTAAAAQHSRLRRLAVPISGAAGALQGRHIALVCALVELVPSIRALEPRPAHDDAAARAPDLVALGQDIAAALGSAVEAVRTGVEVKPRTAPPPWV
ncbi:hypothetical protein H4R21_000904 [Coemansia helicoidea]|uniref:Uncharacterized protein n=1 Tax=Coemansia helicoidea TaxID=1286919 RepID=A0ACC1LF64_9FUNG|nr:hypothetical protein H4R21_000904 [Coemansia helicoidea]